MAKLYYRYGAMNCGKSTAVLQVAHNYEERGMRVCLIKPSVDTKGSDTIVSRLGTTRKVDLLLAHDRSAPEELAKHDINTLSCVLVDEAQFLTPTQVDELFWFAISKNIPVICYGLRTDFKTVGFPGSTRLLEMAHSLEELKTICRCGRKAMLNGRKINGNFIFEGEQVAIDGKDSVEYESLCANCYLKEKSK